MKLAIKRICVPTDFSEAADHAVHYAAALAETYGATLHLLHVIEHAGPLVHHPDFTADGEIARDFFNKLERAVVDADANQPAESKSDDTVPEFIQSIKAVAVNNIESVGQPWWESLDVHRDIRYGHAVKEINHYVQKLEIDLVIMGTHGHSKLVSVLLGSVTERTVRTCGCPVMVIRHPDHAYDVIDESSQQF